MAFQINDRMKYSVGLRRLAGWLNVNMDPSLILFFQKIVTFTYSGHGTGVGQKCVQVGPVFAVVGTYDAGLEPAGPFLL